ncbi:putative S-adenosyl-L-methionine-dependent methyltransferase [Helianthus annuus]|nr:putative S-adenosyl-L-methionine-dependent methyltransferase [Helianthus annuus]KAJ0717043.1 putative S-adenosyl-L-methionine-dependent methyltransferase [Helianthus annuus]
MFEKDTELWRKRVENYWDLLSPKISANTIRNVMDMKANLGSFGAALGNKDVWVMNVVPEDGPNTLKLIYDRGLIGSIHNCGEDLLIEIDRILRPTGFLIVRDKKPVIDFVKKYLPAIHWETVAVADSPSESDGDDVVLIVQKKLWLTSESLRETD